MKTITAEKCKHKFEYKETIAQERFDSEMLRGEYHSTGKRLDDRLFAIFVCSEYLKIRKEKI